MEANFCILLRHPQLSHDQPEEAPVQVNDRDALDQDVDDGIIFEEFVTQARAYLTEHPPSSLVGWDIYVGFWGQWSCQIPGSFFAFIVETGLPVKLDIDD